MSEFAGAKPREVGWLPWRVVLALSACDPDQLCLDLVGRDLSSIGTFVPATSPVVNPRSKSAGSMAYACCAGGPTTMQTCPVDCTGVTVGQAGQSWGEVSWCEIAVRDGKVAAAWVLFD